MKKSILYSLLFLLISSVIYGDITIEASKKAIELWFYTLLPSFLFPLIIIRLISPYHVFETILKPFNKIITFLFHMDLYTFEVIFTSLFLGFPSNALFIEEIVPEHISSKAYEKCIYIPFMSSFNFILVTLSVLYSFKTLITLLLIQVFTIFILLFLQKEKIVIPIKKEKTVFKIQFLNSIHKAFHIMLLILAYLIITYVVLALLNKFIPSKILLPFSILAEFASGCFKIHALDLPLFYKIFFTNLLLSYGGLCVHLQLITNLSDKFNYLTFLKYRIKHMFISSILLLIVLFPYSHP